MRYCRSVTLVWCAFFVVNGAAAALLAAFAPRGWWAGYTGVVSYVLVGALFAAEYVVRKARFGRFGRGPVDRLLAHVPPEAGHRMIRHLLARSPAQLVAVGDAGPRTLADLLADSARIARALRGRPAGDVLLIFEDRYAFAAALLGAWRARRAVLLPPNGQPDTIRTLARRQGVAAFLHDRRGSPEGEDLSSLLGGPPAEERRRAPAGRDVRVATLATSGSTGDHAFLPKTAGQLLGEAGRSSRSSGSAPPPASSRRCPRTTSTGCSSACSCRSAPARRSCARRPSTRRRSPPRCGGTARRTS